MIGPIFSERISRSRAIWSSRRAQAPRADPRLGAGERGARYSPRCFQKTSRVKPRNSKARSNRPEQRRRDRRDQRRGEPAERGIAGQEQQCRSRWRHKPRAPRRRARRPGRSRARPRNRSRRPCRRRIAARPARGGRPSRRSRRAGRCRATAASASSRAAVPLAMSSSRVAAARPLRPVRSTLVAPILPEPICRRSPAPVSRVRSDAERDRAQRIAEQQGGEQVRRSVACPRPLTEFSKSQSGRNPFIESR